MGDTFKAKHETMWGVDKYIIKPRMKGTLIYKETRENHVAGMEQMIEEGWELIGEHEYLVFDIPTEVHPDFFREVFNKGLTGLRVRSFGDWTEVSCHYPNALHNGMLDVLRKMKIIRVAQKEMTDGVSYYINPSGWQLVYNLIALGTSSLKRWLFSGWKTPAAVDQEPDEVNPD